MSFLSLPSTSQWELVNITRQKWEVRRWGHHLVCHHVGRHTIKQRGGPDGLWARQGRTLHYMKYLHTGSTHIVIMSYSHNVIMSSCRHVQPPAYCMTKSELPSIGRDNRLWCDSLSLTRVGGELVAQHQHRRGLLCGDPLEVLGVEHCPLQQSILSTRLCDNLQL